MLDEQGDVFAPLAQRRQLDRDDVQPVEEILAERAVGDHLPRDRELVAAMTRTSTLIVCASPSGSNSRSCSTRSSFACSAGLIVADLVEEERAAVRLLETPLAGADARR